MMKNESLNTKICAKQDAKQLNCREQLLGEPSFFRIRDQVTRVNPGWLIKRPDFRVVLAKRAICIAIGSWDGML